MKNMMNKLFVTVITRISKMFPEDIISAANIYYCESAGELVIHLNDGNSICDKSSGWKSEYLHVEASLEDLFNPRKAWRLIDNALKAHARVWNAEEELRANGVEFKPCGQPDDFEQMLIGKEFDCYYKDGELNREKFWTDYTVQEVLDFLSTLNEEEEVETPNYVMPDGKYRKLYEAFLAANGSVDDEAELFNKVIISAMNNYGYEITTRIQPVIKEMQVGMSWHGTKLEHESTSMLHVMILCILGVSGKDAIESAISEYIWWAEMRAAGDSFQSFFDHLKAQAACPITKEITSHFADAKTKKEIQSIKRKLSRKHHPDRGGDAEMMVRINQMADELIAAIT